MKQVYVARDLLDAQFIKNRLEEEGIESVIQGEILSGVWGAVPIAPDTSPSIWVVQDCDFERAVDCLEKQKQHSPDPAASDWKCEKCGETIESHFTDCWRCALTPGEETPEPDLTDENSPSDTDHSETSRTIEGTPDASTSGAETHRSNRDLWAETSLVILVCILTDGYSALALLIWPYEYQNISSFQYSLSYLMSDAVYISLVTYLIWRSGESWSRFGLVRPKWLRDSLLGLAFWMSAWAIHRATWIMIGGFFGPSLFKSENHENPFLVPVPIGVIAGCLFVISVCTSAFAEELVFRAYLFLRLERLLGSTTKSMLVTTCLFASVHIYQGTTGTIGAFIFGLLYGLVFLWFRRLWPVALAHAISNLLVYWREFAEQV